MRIWALISNVDDIVGQYGFRIFDDMSLHPWYEVLLVDYADLTISTEDGFSVWSRGKKLELPDAFWPMLTNTDAFCLEHMLIEAGCKSILNLEEVAVARSKLRTYQRLAANGIRVPRTVAFFTHPDRELITSSFKYPFVVKPDNGYGGAGVALIEDEAALDEYLSHLDPGVVYIAQEYISSSRGRDLRVIYFQDEFLYAVQRQASDPEEFRSNAHVGGSITPFEPDEHTKDLCARIAGLFDLPLLGIDLLFGDGEFVVTEVNAYPGMTDDAFKKKVAEGVISDFTRRTQEGAVDG